MNETTTATRSTKTTLRSELEATQAAYHELIDGITDAQWSAPSANPGWTCGQLAWHVASGVNFSIGIIKKARNGRGTNVPSFLMPLAYKANEFLVRRRSRNATPASVRSDFDTGMKELLALLDDVQESELAVVKTNFGRTDSVEDMFLIPVGHFGEHAPEIRNAPARA